MFSSRLTELASCLEECCYTDGEKEISESKAHFLFCKLIQEAFLKGGIVYVVGNGGSAGIAAHFSNDLMKALKIRSQTLYEPNLLTCLANDIGYEHAFSYMLERLLTDKDLLVAISSSGKSSNILNAVTLALGKNVPVITLSGFKRENPLQKLGILNFWIDREDYGLVETAHFFLLHTVVDRWNLRNDYARVDNTLCAKQN